MHEDGSSLQRQAELLFMGVSPSLELSLYSRSPVLPFPHVNSVTVLNPQP